MLLHPSLLSPSLPAIAPADAALLARLHALDAALGLVTLGPGSTCPPPPIGAPCTLTAARVARAVAHLQVRPI